MDIPKIELHAHLHGSIRRSTLQEFLSQEGSSESFSQKVTLEEAFRLFKLVHSVVTTPQRVSKITQEMIEDFQAEGCVYLEIRTTPKASDHMTKKDYMQAVTETIQNYSGQMTVKLLVSVNRSFSLEEAKDNLELAKESSVCVGLDFSGNPTIGKFSQFKAVFEEARAAGLKVTVHTGEIPHDEQDTLEILNFKPDRLGHCNFLTEEAQEFIVENKIPIEVCPSSNMATIGLDSIIDHHFGYFFSRNHPVAVCTDDTLLFNTSLTQELEILRKGFGLSIENLKKVQQDAADMAFSEVKLINEVA